MLNIATATTYNYENMNMCIQLCSQPSEAFSIAAAIYNEGAGQVYAKCLINVPKDQPTGTNVCCSTGTMNATFSDKVDGSYTAFAFSFPEAVPTDECLTELVIQNNGETKKSYAKFIHHNTNKCGLTDKYGTCTVLSTHHNFKTGEYKHIHVGSKYCESGGATLDNPVSSYCSSVHVFNCEKANC